MTHSDGGADATDRSTCGCHGAALRAGAGLLNRRGVSHCDIHNWNRDTGSRGALSKRDGGVDSLRRHHADRSQSRQSRGGDDSAL